MIGLGSRNLASPLICYNAGVCDGNVNVSSGTSQKQALKAQGWKNLHTRNPQAGRRISEYNENASAVRSGAAGALSKSFETKGWRAQAEGKGCRPEPLLPVD